MCGILGIFPDGEVDLHLCQKALQRLRHRGPDDEGYLVFKEDRLFPALGAESMEELRSEMPLLEAMPFRGGNGLLGHRRLSIIDLSPSGHQPMSYAEGDVWIVYNGEVYNYIELREELQQEGFSLKTQSDTEVILAAYVKWGKQCLHRFNGMWGFCIYDRKKHILFCARDRWGIKPFYYLFDGKNFAFASEIKALALLPWGPGQPNPHAVIPYLYFGMHDFTDETFFTSIRQLPPGHCLEFDLRRRTLQVEKFYHLEFNPSLEETTPEQEKECTEKFRALFEDAIRLRLRSDVPVGSCLSGGLDSSSIVCTAAKKWWDHPSFVPQRRSSTFCTFTADFPGLPISERSFVEEVIRTTGVKAHFTSPDSCSLQEDLKDLIYFQEEPFGSLSIYAQYCVMRLAHQAGMKVLLDGQGADEILAGYIQKHIPIHSFSLLKSGRLHCIPWELWTTPSYLWRVAFLFLPRRIRYWYLTKHNTPFFRGREKEVRNLLLQFIGYEYETSSLNANLYRELRIRLPRLLKYEDRNSMAFSIETRLPFLDYRFVEWLMSLPSAYKIHQNVSKYLLRESLKGILPEKIRLRRDKIGFAIPQDRWLAELAESWKPLLQKEKESFLAEYVEIAKVLDQWNSLLHYERQSSRNAILWRIVNLKLWYDSFWGTS
ncbi:MAG TPA: asparagine synthase (glutamine-hydrolyzing) [Thermoguttaceae bacterium]|nr:asparagine synthase (glutamine-hydrolyzing) [Thermoguttaceae bacterium]HPP53102.1 asparagine synthase (glutamine-hydrolyzing) [Thermoguttaceae bacterium]